MHICGIQKRGIDDLICKVDIETDTENKHMDTKGEGGGGMNWEMGTDV